jgi:putative 4-mercaptohistidine N1-methyltranferase
MSTATPRVDPNAFSTSERENPYESDRLLSEYLLFHYGEPSEVLPFEQGPVSALGYPVRCVSECLDASRLGEGARALDLGCAVGRATFELARVCQTVVGIDYSHRFVGAAEIIRTKGALDYLRTDEGDLKTPLRALRPEGVDPERVHFEQGDAMGLRKGMGQFDVVLMANLIDRLSAPMRCLESLEALVVPGGQLIVTSPYTWMQDYTPREHWLGGRENGGRSQSTLEGLELALGESFALEGTKDLPFLIREHVRKYQWSMAQASVWRRR